MLIGLLLFRTQNKTDVIESISSIFPNYQKPSKPMSYSPLFTLFINMKCYNLCIKQSSENVHSGYCS